MYSISVADARDWYSTEEANLMYRQPTLGEACITQGEPDAAEKGTLSYQYR